MLEIYGRYLIIALAMRYHSYASKVCLNILENALALSCVRSQLAFAPHHPLLFKSDRNAHRSEMCRFNSRAAGRLAKGKIKGQGS